ncbi:MAG: glycosyl hydrolase, partial [Nitrososphaerota archaeon]
KNSRRAGVGLMIGVTDFGQLKEKTASAWHQLGVDIVRIPYIPWWPNTKGVGPLAVAVKRRGMKVLSSSYSGPQDSVDTFMNSIQVVKQLVNPDVWEPLMLVNHPQWTFNPNKVVEFTRRLVDSGEVAIGPSISVWFNGWEQYLSSLYQQGIGELVIAQAVSFFPTHGWKGTKEEIFEVLDTVVRITGKPIWVVETGWTPNSNEADIIEQMRTRFRWLGEHPMVEAVFWWPGYVNIGEVPGPAWRNTLVYDNGNLKSYASEIARPRITPVPSPTLPGLYPGFPPRLVGNILTILSSYSPGRENQTITSLYYTVLRRPPDDSGLRFYVNYLSSTRDPVRVFISFVVGAEQELRSRMTHPTSSFFIPGFVVWFPTRPTMDVLGILSNYSPGREEQAVSAFYYTILSRPPDTGGLRFYVSYLSSTHDPVRVLMSFVRGAEQELRSRIVTRRFLKGAVDWGFFGGSTVPYMVDLGMNFVRIPLQLWHTGITREKVRDLVQRAKQAGMTVVMMRSVDRRWPDASLEGLREDDAYFAPDYWEWGSTNVPEWYAPPELLLRASQILGKPTLSYPCEPWWNGGRSPSGNVPWRRYMEIVYGTPGMRDTVVGQSVIFYPNSGWYGRVEEMQALMEEIVNITGGKPIWIMETGYTPSRNEDEVINWIHTYYSTLFRLQNVVAVCYWPLVVMGRLIPGLDHEHVAHNAPLTDTLERRSIYYALRRENIVH